MGCMLLCQLFTHAGGYKVQGYTGQSPRDWGVTTLTSINWKMSSVSMVRSTTTSGPTVFTTSRNLVHFIHIKTTVVAQTQSKSWS